MPMMRFLIVVLLSSSTNAFAILAINDRGAPRRSSVMRMMIEAPPTVPPMHVDNGNGGDGDDDLILEKISASQRRAALQLWLWQQEASKSTVPEVSAPHQNHDHDGYHDGYHFG